MQAKIILKYKTKTIPQLKKEADRLFSLVVRQRNAKDGYVTCCTCGKIGHWRRFHLGHFMPRQYLSTRFNYRNTDIQCVNCNTFNEGMQFEFSKYLDKKYGKGTAELMLYQSKQSCKISRFFYIELIEDLKRFLKENNFEKR